MIGSINVANGLAESISPVVGKRCMPLATPQSNHTNIIIFAVLW